MITPALKYRDLSPIENEILQPVIKRMRLCNSCDAGDIVGILLSFSGDLKSTAESAYRMADIMIKQRGCGMKRHYPRRPSNPFFRAESFYRERLLSGAFLIGHPAFPYFKSDLIENWIKDILDYK